MADPAIWDTDEIVVTYNEIISDYLGISTGKPVSNCGKNEIERACNGILVD